MLTSGRHEPGLSRLASVSAHADVDFVLTLTCPSSPILSALSSFNLSNISLYLGCVCVCESRACECVSVCACVRGVVCVRARGWAGQGRRGGGKLATGPTTVAELGARRWLVVGRHFPSPLHTLARPWQPLTWPLLLLLLLPRPLPPQQCSPPRTWYLKPTAPAKT